MEILRSVTLGHTLGLRSPGAIDAPPALDGKLDDAVWQQGQWYGNFTLLGEGAKPATAQTRFKVAFDDQKLYLAAELLDRWAPEPDADHLARLAAITPAVAPPAWLADPFVLELHTAYLQARERVGTVHDDTSTAATMTAAAIGEQRTEILRKEG